VDCRFDYSACIEPQCGNGTIEDGEACEVGESIAYDCADFGYNAGEVACVDCTIDISGCYLVEGCGDGILREPEQCDDGNVLSGDGCSTICLIEDGCQPTTVGPLRISPHSPIAVKDEYVLVDGTGSLDIFELTDPSRPRLVARLDDRRLLGVRAIEVHGDVAYVVSWRGLWLVDISDPTAPFIVGSYQDALPHWYFQMTVWDGQLALCHWPSLLVDVRDPRAPTLTAALGNVCLAVAHQNDVLFLSNYYRDIEMVDVADPLAPERLGIFTPPALIRSMTAWDTYLGIGFFDETDWSDGGFSVWSVSDPTEPALLGEIDLDCPPNQLFFSGDLLLARLTRQRIGVLDVSVPSEPRLLSTVESYLSYSPAPDEEIAGMGNLLISSCVAPACAGLHVFDLSTPEEPVELARVGFGDFATGLAIVDNYAYIGGAGLLSVYDITDLALPQHESSLKVFHDASSSVKPPVILTVAGDLLFVWCDHVFAVFDITVRAEPVFLGEMPLWGWGEMRAIDEHVYLANDDEMYVVSVSDPTEPTLAAVFVHPGESDTPRHDFDDLVVSGDLVFLEDRYYGVAVVDASDPTEPYLLTELRPFRPSYGPPYVNVMSSIDVHDHRLFATGVWSGEVHVFDISAPTQIEEEVVWDLPHDVGDIAVWDELALVRYDYYLFSAYDISEISDPRLVTTFDRVEIGHFYNLGVFSGLPAAWGHGVSFLVDLPGQCESTCGNTITEHPETCDDGNRSGGDGCAANCRLETCPDGSSRQRAWIDNDGDSWGTDGGPPRYLCQPLATNLAAQNGDCDDERADVNPDQTETCEPVDVDCDGLSFVGADAPIYYPDEDGDGYGVTFPEFQTCRDPGSGWVLDSGDCDDFDPATSPASAETCGDDVDNNCDPADDC
jgi:cysteine-rich repeat protein